MSVSFYRECMLIFLASVLRNYAQDNIDVEKNYNFFTEIVNLLPKIVKETFLKNLDYWYPCIRFVYYNMNLRGIV